MHKEPEYNWIEMYQNHFHDKLKKYDELIEYLRKEYNEEESIVKEQVNKRIKQEEAEEQEKIKNREENKKLSEKPKKEKEDKNKRLLMKQIYEFKNDLNIKNSEKTWRKIAIKFEINHVTAKSYYENYEKILEEENKPDSIKSMIGFGIMPEEINSNFSDINN